MRPRLLKGRKSADLVPTTNSISPKAIFTQISDFFVELIEEWYISGSKPNSPLNSIIHWLVRIISGTKTKHWKPFSNVSWIILEYTRVFPEPVTPSNKMVLKDFKLPILIFLTAFCCSWFKSFERIALNFFFVLEVLFFNL